VKAIEPTQYVPPGLAHIRQGVWANQVVPPRTQSTGTPQYSGFPVTIEPAMNEKLKSALELVQASVGLWKGGTDMPKLIKGVGCPYCGSSCDDIEVLVSDDETRILEVHNACIIGNNLFHHANDPPARNSRASASLTAP